MTSKRLVNTLHDIKWIFFTKNLDNRKKEVFFFRIGGGNITLGLFDRLDNTIFINLKGILYDSIKNSKLNKFDEYFNSLLFRIINHEFLHSLLHKISLKDSLFYNTRSEEEITEMMTE